MATSPTFSQPTKTSGSGDAAQDDDASSSQQQQQKVQVHEPSGYRWSRPEDAPGLAWRKRNAAKERTQAKDQIVGWDTMIGTKYGDVGLAEAKAKGY